jgi:hypothetical protein
MGRTLIDTWGPDEIRESPRQYGFVSGTVPDEASGTTRPLVQQVATPQPSRLADAVRTSDDQSRLVGRAEGGVRGARTFSSYPKPFDWSRFNFDETDTADEGRFDLVVKDVLGEEAVEIDDRAGVGSATSEATEEDARGERTAPGGRTAMDGTDATKADEEPTRTAGQQYLDRLLDVIPIEVITAWVFISGVANADAGMPDRLYFAVTFIIAVLAGTLVVKTAREGSQTPSRSRAKVAADRLGQGFIATVAFLVWAYYLGQPFAGESWYIPSMGPIALAIFSLSAPLVPRFVSRRAYWFTSRIYSDDEGSLVLTGLYTSVAEGGDPTDEHLVFRNVGSERLDLSQWTVSDEYGHVAVLPSGLALAPGGTLTLYTGRGDDDLDTQNAAVYWNAPRAMWNDDGDVVAVRDRDNHERLRVAYGPRD